MAARNCEACNIVGKKLLKNEQQTEPTPPKIRRNVYELGNGYSTSDEGEAKDLLMKRDYVKIFYLKNVNKNNFKPGIIGVNILPEVRSSKIPKIVEPQRFYEVRPKLNHIFRTVDETKIVLEHIRGEGAEVDVINGIENYFQAQKNEDVFIFINQDFKDEKRKAWVERDALVVNCTRGYIIVIEAKNVLNKSKMAKGLQQLEETLEHTLTPISSNINQKWDVYCLLYGSTINPKYYVCPTCKPYVITNSDGNFSDVLTKILSAQIVKDWKYAQDYHYLIREILPLRIRIANNLVSAFNARKSLMKKISENVQVAGQAEVIAFWTKKQYNLAHECLIFKRILFDSCFSTGKTLLMMDCIEKLIAKNEKVIYLINTEGHPFPQSLLYFKMQHHFCQMYGNTNFENNFIIEERNLNDTVTFEQLSEKYANYHIFIDEIRFEHGIDYNTLKTWSSKISEEKHLWIAICYGKEKFNSTQLSENFEIFSMEYALRNNATTLELVQSKIDAISSSALNDKTNIDKMKIPSNQTKSFDLTQFIFEANNYSDGLKQALSALECLSKTQPALIVIPWLKCSTDMWCQSCYHDQCVKIIQFKKHINDLYSQINRQEPVIYFNNADSDEAKAWVENPNERRDMVTDYEVVNGFEHDVVIIVQKLDQNTFEHNMVMRSITLPIIVKISSEQWSEKCFGKFH